MSDVQKRGNALRFTRPNLADVTFLAVNRITKVVEALTAHGVTVEDVIDWR
jgi:hypothetical protein